MHIPDGFLPAPVWLGGYAVAGATLWLSLRQISQLPNPQASVPKASLLTAAFFVASWIHIPIPPASVHLILNGLLGVMLGPFAFPAIAIGLLFQSVLFQHGGISTLGVNAVIIGIPALIAAQVFKLLPRLPQTPWITGVIAGVAGASGLILSALLFCLLLVVAIPANMDAQTERLAIWGLTLAHLPVALLEGAVTAAIVLFLKQVKPELLEQPKEFGKAIRRMSQ